VTREDRWFRRSALLVAALACVGVATDARAQRGDRPVGTIVASNMNDNTATVLDAATGRVLATLPTGEGPHEVAISRDGRWAVVSNYGVRGKPGSTITVIDVVRHEVVRTIDLHEYQRPHGMAFLPGDTVLAVTAQGNSAVLLVNFRDGTVGTLLQTNGRGSHMLGLSADGERMVTGNIADSTITVLHPLSAGDGNTVHVAAQPEGIAIAPDGATAWVGSNRDSVVLVVDLRRGIVIDTLRGFGLPYRMAISPDGRRAVVTDPAKAQVRIFDAATRRERTLIQVPRDSVVATAEVPGSPSPEGIVISPDSRWAFVTLQGRNRLATIDIERGTIVALAPTGTWSDGVAFSRLVSRP
jgi:YVTN family beta-propeller protein